MTMRQVTIISYDGAIFGVLLDNDEYVAPGGQSLANAFDDHHVQLVRAPSGQYRIVDDMGSDAFTLVDGVSVDEQPTARGQVGAPWKLSTEQSDDVRCWLEELTAESI
jgi:hypothetical protein